MAGDASVYVPTLTTGTKIDVTELTTQSGTVERQRVEIPGIVSVVSDAQSHVLAELRVISAILAHGFQIDTEDVDAIRADIAAQIKL